MHSVSVGDDHLCNCVLPKWRKRPGKMTKRRKLMNIDEKCRVCLSDDGCMSDIFAEDLKPKINDLGNSTSIHINNDENLPRNICHVCLYKLDMWIEFKQQYLRSNATLCEYLGVSEPSEKATPVTKTKLTEKEKCLKDNSAEHSVTKKGESDKSIPISMCRANEETVEKVELNSNSKPMKMEDSTVKNMASKEEISEQKDVSKNTSSVSGTTSPVKPIICRRSKTTERRKASTKRWVARKKALLAATGENDTDTDSVSSDEAQLSPVQKARAKCNAEKIVETQRRMSKTMIISDTEICANDEKKVNIEDTITNVDSQREMINETIKTEPIVNSQQANEPSKVEEKISTLSENPTNSMNISNKTNNFIPHSVKSEFVIDDSTFIVTSTLVLTEPHHLSPTKCEANNSTIITDDINLERNTDIIDAVQLRRVVSTKATLEKDKKMLERCLNIEVEGTELESLQRVQSELAQFVEKKLFYIVDNNKKCVSQEPFQTLEQQLKTIVEKTIMKNLENTRSEKLSRIMENRGNKTFTGEFVRAAMRSKIFQPCVMLVRCDAERDVKSEKTRIIERKISISSQLEKTSILGKRRSVKPAKYADYDGAAYNTDSDEEKSKKSLIAEARNKVKTYGPAATKIGQVSLLVNPRNGEKSLETVDHGTSLQSTTPNVETISHQPANASTTDDLPKSTITGEKHICGVCGDFFGTRKEVETHFGSHGNLPHEPKETRRKMMRCKRCHDIVDARYVKSHVCLSANNIYKCTSCDSTFRNEKMLVKHLEVHRIEDKVEDMETKEETRVIERTKASKILTKRVVSSGQNRETYTCFVCDKVFDDEEILKDHLQKHCDDISEDEPSDDKELYQCAICGQSMESEDALESHVEKHLFDDEDDNPNLISISNDLEKTTSRNMPHACQQCNETFDSEMLLMLHMQAHEEEIAIAEWEKRGTDNNQEQHVCVICDDIFNTEAELSEHLDIHNGNAHVCLLCDKPFLTIEELQAHVNTH